MERYYLELEKEYMPYAIFDKTGTMIALKQDTPIKKSSQRTYFDEQKI